MGSQTRRTATDLQNPQPSTLRQGPRRLLNRGRDRRQPLTSIQPVAIKLIEQVRPSSRKQHLDRILFPTQNRAQLSAIRRTQQPLRKMPRMRQHKLAQQRLRRIRFARKYRSRYPASWRIFQNTSLDQTRHQSLKNRLHRWRDSQAFSRKSFPDLDPHFSQSLSKLPRG